MWLPSAGRLPVTASTTRGPANPTVAPSTATRRSAALATLIHTPPVVGASATDRCARPSAARSSRASRARGMPTSAAIPSCSRVPPERTTVSSGSLRARAWATASTRALASASPNDPPYTEKSHTAATAPSSSHTATACRGV